MVDPANTLPNSLKNIPKVSPAFEKWATFIETTLPIETKMKTTPLGGGGDNQSSSFDGFGDDDDDNDEAYENYRDELQQNVAFLESMGAGDFEDYRGEYDQDQQNVAFLERLAPNTGAFVPEESNQDDLGDNTQAFEYLTLLENRDNIDIDVAASMIGNMKLRNALVEV